MKKQGLFVKIVLIAVVLLLLISLAAPAIFSSSPMPTPRRETLLNGTRLITYPDAQAAKVWVRIRIHAGSAFDPQGKEGVMMLLSQNLFPNAAAVEYFEEDLGGSLSVVCGYDFIQITASSRPEEFLSMLETLATAVSSPTINKETTEELRSRLGSVQDAVAKEITTSADLAVRQRLFGNFPYGRPEVGTPVSLKNITFADIIEARKRFLNADNTTVVISGRFDRSLAVRAAKRYFGGWLKSDRKVPPTFRRPEEPAADLAIMSSQAPGEAQVRFAVRGVARADKGFPAAEVFARIMQERLARKAVADPSDIKVTNTALMLPGYLLFGIPASAIGGTDNPARLVTALNSIIAETIDIQEFTAARARASDAWRSRPIEEFWLDADTYKLASAEDDMNAFDQLTLADVRAFADGVKRAPMASLLMFPAGSPE